jgi:hypothetical protein
MTVIVPATTIEKFDTPIDADEDPTGTLPEWSFTATETPGTYNDGEWASGETWAAGTRVTAISPTVGATGATVVLAAGTWFAWVRVTIGSEVIVRKVDTFTLR